MHQKADLDGVSNYMNQHLLYLQTHTKTQLNKVGYSSKELSMKH